MYYAELYLRSMLTDLCLMYLKPLKYLTENLNKAGLKLKFSLHVFEYDSYESLVPALVPVSRRLRLLLKNGRRLGFGVLDIDIVSCSPVESSSQLSDSSSWNRA